MSTLMISGALAIAAVPVVIGYFLNRSTIKRIEQISESDETLTEISRPESDSFKEAIRNVDSWANGHGFNLHKLLQMKVGRETSYIATWQDKKHARVLLVHHSAKKDTHELMTRFDDGSTLSTSDDKNIHALPAPPDMFVQNFCYFNLDMLLGEHVASEAYMESNYALERVALSEHIKDDIYNNLCAQITYVKSLLMWKIKGPYWTLFRRQFRSNSPVKTLY